MIKFWWDFTQAAGCISAAAVVMLIGLHFTLAVFSPGGKHE